MSSHMTNFRLPTERQVAKYHDQCREKEKKRLKEMSEHLRVVAHFMGLLSKATQNRLNSDFGFDFERKDDFAAVLDGLQMTVQDEMEREG